MFCSKELNKKINSLHKRALRIVYLDYTSSFEELLEKDKAVTIHQRNIQLLAIELFKVINRQGADIVWDLFTFNKDKRVEKTFCRPNVNTVSYGEQSIRYFGTVVWDSMVPPELKSITSLDKFKSEIEQDRGQSPKTSRTSNHEMSWGLFQSVQSIRQLRAWDIFFFIIFPHHVSKRNHVKI